MPKITDTRKQRAAELLERLERGPAFSSLVGPLQNKEAAEAAAESYRLWVRSWILPEIKKLVPELRKTTP